jgi:hypothetical protein
VDRYSSEDSLFNGPVWHEMLKNNHSLKTLSFANCFPSVEGLHILARGLSCNTSLETLDLSNTDMGESSVTALVDGLRTNKTLKSLDLSYNCDLSQSAIERLMGYNFLRELKLAEADDSVGASILASGLSDNHSLEKLDLRRAFVDGEGVEGVETFLALCESLRGNTALRYLNVGYNGVDLDGVCATALKLDTMSLETLNLDHNVVTSCGIAALAQ